MDVNIQDSLSAFMVLFAVIDIIGAIPLIISLKNKGNTIEPIKTSLFSLFLLLLFLFMGQSILGLFGVDIRSFAIAGSFVLFILSMEMVLGNEFFKNDSPSGVSLVPLAFPLIAGAGSFTTLLSLQSLYSKANIVLALVLNIGIVFLVLKLTARVERILGPTGIHALRKIFGIILLSVSIKMFGSSIGSIIDKIQMLHH
jgi:multiple antibiotic resistance protein